MPYVYLINFAAIITGTVTMIKRWKYKPAGDEETVSKLSRELNINKTLANLLVQRGISSFDEARNFFRPSLDSLHDPFLMLNMEKAVERISKAISNNEHILIYGDYDVDGTTAVALVYSYFKDIYYNIEYYIPDRYKEGYGISYDGIDYAYKKNISLVISLDCGIKAVEKIDYANEKNIDFIICDHHLPGDVLPAAYAILDPKQPGCEYPYKELSGCGVGFKLAQAFGIKNNIPANNIYQHLDLVAISIAADIVDITGENRILAYYGLKKINEEPRPGIESILEFTNVKRVYDKNNKKTKFSKTLTISDLVFIMAPRINAAGRISDGSNSVNLLKCRDKRKSYRIAEEINKFNIERRELDQNITKEALEIIENIENYGEHKSTVVYKEDWHKGVLGIVASRLIEHYYRPTIVLTLEGDTLTGSARSVKGFDIYSAIDSCSDLMENFGGHKFAAGMTIKKKNIKEFIRRFEESVTENIEKKMEMPEIEIDSELSLKDINDKFVTILNQFAPFGPGNLAPIFSTSNVRDTGYCRIVGDKHLKMKLVENGDFSHSFDDIAFQQSDKLNIAKENKPFSICYAIEENHWQNKVTIQLLIKDIIRP
jgi:single-stranded-DNA-specific exonuclease